MALKINPLYLTEAACFLFLSVQTLNAQTKVERGEGSDSTEHQLTEIVVTAGRSRQFLKDVPQKIEVISAKDIRATSAMDVTDLLKKNAAVSVIQYPGLLSGIGIRGFRPEYDGLNQHTLLLVNGRQAGTTNMGTLDLTNIDRIEVLKGPASALYGSQAMGGVVNIIPLHSTGNIGGNLFGQYGSFNTWQAGGHAGGNLSKKLDFDVAGTYFNRESDFKLGNGNFFRKMLGSGTALDVFPDGKDSLVNDKRDDGQKRPYTRYSYGSGSTRLGYQLSEKWRIDATEDVFIADNVESPGDVFSGNAGASLKNEHRSSSELALTGKAGANDLSARIYYSGENTDFFAIQDNDGNPLDTSYLDYKENYKWYGLQLRDVINLGRQHLVAGYDYNHAATHAYSYDAPQGGEQTETAYTPNSTLVTNGFYAQGQLSLANGKLKVNPGIRMDITKFSIGQTPGYTQALYAANKTNNFLSPDVSAQYTFIKGMAVHGSIGRAFVTPDASSVAGYSVAGQGTGHVEITQGNTGLKNESSLSEELGIKYQNLPTGIDADVTWFSTNVNNRVATISSEPDKLTLMGNDTVTAITTFRNADKSHIRGLEFMASYDFGALNAYRYSLRVFTNITKYFEAKDLGTSGTVGNYAVDVDQIQNVAKANINYGIEYSNNKRFSTRVTGRYVGRRWDTDFNDPRRPLVYYPSFMTLDWSASYLIGTQHQLTAIIDNITDENYYEKRGYNLPGRSFSLRYTWLFGVNKKNKL